MIVIDLDSLGPVLMMLTAIVTIGAFVLGSHRGLSKQFDTKLKALDTKFEAKFDAIDVRFDAIDRRFETIDRRFEAIDTRFDTLEARLSTHEIETSKQLGRVHISVSKLEERFDLWERILLPLIAGTPQADERRARLLTK